MNIIVPFILILTLMGCCGPRGQRGDAGLPGLPGAPGVVGPGGETGERGPAGHVSLVTMSEADVSVCPTGGYVFKTGVDVDDSGILDLSEVTAVAPVCNGLDAGPTPFSPVSVVQPCGNTTTYKEVLLCLQNGSLLASFSQNGSALTTRLAIVTAGSYIDTDGSHCEFTVEVAPGHSSSVSWPGGLVVCTAH